jgi:hypothetical protein
MGDRGGRLTPSDEVIFFEKIYTLLHGVPGYLQGDQEGEKRNT